MTADWLKIFLLKLSKMYWVSDLRGLNKGRSGNRNQTVIFVQPYAVPRAREGKEKDKSRHIIVWGMWYLENKMYHLSHLRSGCNICTSCSCPDKAQQNVMTHCQYVHQQAQYLIHNSTSLTVSFSHDTLKQLFCFIVSLVETILKHFRKLPYLILLIGVDWSIKVSTVHLFSFQSKVSEMEWRCASISLKTLVFDSWF